MELLKQLFPYNLNGPQFLLFYALLLAGMLIFAYTIHKKEVTAELMEDLNKLHVQSAYELAYLRGGEKTFYELIISELIEEKKLAQNGTDYIVNKNIKLENPLSIYLDTLNKDVITLEQLFEVAQAELKSVKEKFLGLLELQDGKMPRISLYCLIVVELIGLIRVWQGIQNDKPVGFLIFFMILGGILQYSLHSWPIRKKQSEKYFGQNWEDLHTALSPYQKRLITYGFASICTGTILYQLYPFFSSLDSQRSFSNGSMYDSCGSDCGNDGCSSCSSCGGCGGCGD